MKYTIVRKVIEDKDLKNKIGCATLFDEKGNVIKTYQYPITNEMEDISSVDDMTNVVNLYFDAIYNVAINTDAEKVVDINEKVLTFIQSLLDELNIDHIGK